MPAPKRARAAPPTTARVAAAEKALGLEGMRRLTVSSGRRRGRRGRGPRRGAKLSARLLSDGGGGGADAARVRLGAGLVHHKYSYRGVIVGYHPRCEQSEAWIRQMDVDSLKYGREQPFYHVLPDTRDRPGAQVTYVAQENIMPDFPSEPLQHPMVAEMFGSVDAAAGRREPSDGLRSQYRAAHRGGAGRGGGAGRSAAAAEAAAAEAAAAQAEVEALEAEAMGRVVDDEEELVVEDRGGRSRLEYEIRSRRRGSPAGSGSARWPSTRACSPSLRRRGRRRRRVPWASGARAAASAPGPDVLLQIVRTRGPAQPSGSR